MKKTVLFVLLALVLVSAMVLAITFIPNVIENRKLTIGVTDTITVVCNKDSNGNFSGINCDIIKAIADEIGYTVEFKEIVLSDRDKLLNNGEIDCYIDSSTQLSDKNIASDAFVYSTQTLIYKDILENNNIDDEDIKNYSCAVQKGSSNYDYLISVDAKNIKEYNSLADVVAAVKNDTCSIGVIDYGVYLSDIKNNAKYSNIISGILTEDCGYKLVFRAKDNARVEKFNSGINIFKSNNGIQEILAQYHLLVENSFSIY